MKFKLDLERNIGFREDVWVGNAPFKEVFSNIFRLSSNPKSSVANCYNFSMRVWDPRWRTTPNDWELGEMVTLLELLGNLNPVPDCNDEWTWKLNQKGHFTSKSSYVKLSHITRFSIPQKHLEFGYSLQSVLFYLKLLPG